MATFRVSWQTPDGEKTDWIWARNLKHAEMIAGDREFEAMFPEIRERQIQYSRWLVNAQRQTAIRYGQFGSTLGDQWGTPLSRPLFGW